MNYNSNKPNEKTKTNAPIVDIGALIFVIYSKNLKILNIGNDGGTRTHMVSRQILSLVRLPIPPHRHIQNTYI